MVKRSRFSKRAGQSKALREIKRAKKREEEITRFLDSATIALSPDLPQTREELLAAFHANRREIRNSGIMAFFRHRFTNYDAIMDTMNARWQHPHIPFDAKLRLKNRVARLCDRYLRSIDAMDLKQPTFLHTKFARSGKIC
jgi:DNA primase large subunit